MKKETQIIQEGRRPVKQQGAVNPPLYQTSTILFPTIESYNAAVSGEPHYEGSKLGSTLDYSYGISGTPTTFELQDVLKKLELGDYCAITSSGLSAITTCLFALLNKGDHILMVDTVYGPTRRFCLKELKKYGVETTYYDPRIGSGIEKLIQKNTRAIFLESPGSLTFEVQDVPAIVKVAKKHRITTIIDNSWATPLFFTPLEHGVDISIQAVTKYIAGHSDLLLGAIIGKNNTKNKILNAYRNLGINSSPHDCWLALRGIRSLAARLERQQRTTEKIIKWIGKRKEVKKILYPAHSKSPDYKLWKKLYNGSASLFTLVFQEKYSKKSIYKLINSLKLFGIGASWGGYESLITEVTPSSIRTAVKWEEKGECVRFYIGLEDADDLIDDLNSGFLKLK